MAHPQPSAKIKVNNQRAWREAKTLLRQHRNSLALGIGLMLISRLAGLVLPASTKYLIDEVIGKHDLITYAVAIGTDGKVYVSSAAVCTALGGSLGPAAVIP